MTQTRSKSCSEPMIDKKIQIRIVGPISGSVMRRVNCHPEAPSILAASMSSFGMPCRPARKMITAKPMYFQVITKKRV